MWTGLWINGHRLWNTLWEPVHDAVGDTPKPVARTALTSEDVGGQVWTTES